MIESIQFQNFKVLRETALPLGRFTLIVGANGSGKTTALQALRAADRPVDFAFRLLVTAGVQTSRDAVVKIIVRWGGSGKGFIREAVWPPEGPRTARTYNASAPAKDPERMAPFLDRELSRARVYSLDAGEIMKPVALTTTMELATSGAHLAGVLDRLRDTDHERFEALNDEIGRWLPEFDRILFNTPADGQKAFVLRTREGQHLIEAKDLSQGTLLALAMLTLAYLSDPPPIVCFEEPDRGIHPRLLRDVRDALYRLSYPENFDEKRDPVQVVATTHSPYMLDLFKDHPEEIVIAHRVGQEARFERLSDRTDIDEILQDAHLGDLWYSGILGGVPCQP